jgi:Uma2 family endonuclease
MAALPQQQPDKMTEAEYLAFERASEMKHEYYNGEIFAMVGASESHNLISVNLIRMISTKLRGKGCKVYPSDMKVKIESTRLYTYPDLSVMCGEAQFADGEFDTLLNPAVIIEILSPSTERYDRGKKFQHYREIPSLQEYVLVAQDNPRIERYLRQENGKWELTDAIGIEATIDLTSIDCVLELAEVYEQVTFVEDDASS